MYKRDQNPEDGKEESLKDCEYGNAMVPADPGGMPPEERAAGAALTL